MTARSLDTRMAAAYHEAIQASHTSATVAIHVGREVWDALLRLASRKDEDARNAVGVGLYSGFPLVLETSYAPTTIQVRTVKVIL